MIRVLVTGSRDWTDHQAIAVTLNRFVSERWPKGAGSWAGVLEVLVGDCRGVDSAVKGWCLGASVPCRVFNADWRKWGPSAGPRRNSQMVGLRPDLVLGFLVPDQPCTGTRDCLRKAIASGLHCQATWDGATWHTLTRLEQIAW